MGLFLTDSMWRLTFVTILSQSYNPLALCACLLQLWRSVPLVVDNSKAFNVCWMKYYLKSIQCSSPNDCIVRIIHVYNVKCNLLCYGVVHITESDWHCYFSKCYYMFSFKATQEVGCIMYFVILFLHLSKGFCKDNVCCTIGVYKDIVYQDPLMTHDMTMASLWG